MPVEVTITKSLSAEMQVVSDCREAVKKAEAEMEKCKGELKIAKSLWESAVEELNAAIDTLIETEKVPTLFDGIKDTLADEPTPARTVVSEPAVEESAAAESIPAGEVVFNAIPGGEAGQTLALGAAPAWRALDVTEHLEAHAEVFDALDAADVMTLGQLADALLRGETFGLGEPVVAELKEHVEQASADDERPVRFPRPAADPGVPTRDKFPPDKSGHWEFMAASFYFSHPAPADRDPEVATDYERMLDQIAKYRADKESGLAEPVWGAWSEFEVAVANPAGVSETCVVLYKPDWQGEVGRDEFDLYSPVVSESGKWSSTVRHQVKGGQVQRPKTAPLVEWARELAQVQADKWAKESKRGKGKREKAEKAEKAAERKGA